MVSEAGKQTLLLIAAPIIISASVGVSTFAKWAFERLTKKLDEKLDGKQAKAQEYLFYFKFRVKLFGVVISYNGTFIFFQKLCYRI